jgi:K+ potassium transporter
VQPLQHDQERRRDWETVRRPQQPGRQPAVDAGHLSGLSPIVRNAANGREIAMARWGMPSSQRALMDAPLSGSIQSSSLKSTALPLASSLSARFFVGKPRAGSASATRSAPPASRRGTAIFLASIPNGIPLALTQFVKLNHCLHERVLIVTVLIQEYPRIPNEQRVEVIELVPGITRVILRFGFMQYPTIYDGLKVGCEEGKLLGIDLSNVCYYFGHETIIPRKNIPGMWLWRESIFAYLQRNAAPTAAFFHVPAHQVVEFGTEIEI